jgi:large subunit ribosomal protein L22
MEAIAKLRHLRSSAQKTRLVIDLIRGKNADDALQILRTTNKAVSKDLELLLRSAIANAGQKNLDVDGLFVARAYVDPAPMGRARPRPGPMGRAYRQNRRRSHVTIALAERPAADRRDKKNDTKKAERAKRTAGSKKAAGTSPAQA